MKATTPDNEAGRLVALRAYDVLDTADEPIFDDLTELAAQICGTPTALLTLVDEQRQWFKSRRGFEAHETSRDIAFCAHTILQHGILEVRDAAQDPRFARNPLVNGPPFIRFYAGAPLIAEGHCLGSLAVLDEAPRALTSGQRDALQMLARHAVALLILRRDAAAAGRRRELASAVRPEAAPPAAPTGRTLAEAAAESDRHLRLTLEATGVGLWETDLASGRTAFDARIGEIFGMPAGMLAATLEQVREAIHPDERARVEAATLEALRSGHDYTVEHRVVRPDGGIRWVETRGRVDRGADGRAVRVRGVTWDVTARRKAEEERHQVFERVSDAFVALDREWRYTFVNEKAAAIFGRTARELIGKHIWTEFPQAAGRPVQRACERALARQEPQVIEDYYAPWDRWFENRIHPAPEGVTIYFHEITARRRAEAALRESEQRKTTLIANLPGAVYRCRNDEIWTTEYASPALETLTGHPLAAFFDGRVAYGDLIHPEDRGRVWAVVQCGLAGHESYSLEYRLIRADGQERHVWEQGYGVYGNDSALVALEGFVQDVTALRSAERAARESGERMRAIVDGLGGDMFVALLTPEGVLVEASRSALEAGALTSADVVGRPFAETYWWCHDPAVQQRLRAAIERAVKGEPSRYDEVVRTAAGPLDIDFALNPLRGANGEVAYLVPSARSIGERKQAENALRQANARLQALSQRLVELQETEQRKISAELHDRIGQNLTALDINLGIVESALGARPQPQLARRLQDSRALLRETTTATRELIAELRPAALDEYGVLAGLRGYAEQYRQRTGIAVRLPGAEPAPRLPRAVESALYRIAQEALNNVAKHAGARQVTIALSLAAGCARLVIEDDGAGFDPGAVPADGGGHWGLMMMRERAEAVGGTLSLDSAPGRGTRIAVSVAAAP